MPVTYAVDPELGVVRTTFQGIITYNDVADLSSSLARDPAFKPHFAELAVFEKDCDIKMHFTDFVTLSRLSPFSDNAKRALVARSLAVYGTLRMYQMAKDDNANVQIFETLSEAVAWLELPEKR